MSRATVQAETIAKLAKAELYKAQLEADAKFYGQQKVAESIQAIYQAQAAGIRELQNAFGGNTSATLQYVMLEKGIYQELSKANAEAIRGLAPKITVWNTGGASGENDAGKPIRDLFQALPPLLSTINDQTGIQSPTWLADLSGIAEAGGMVSPSKSAAKAAE